MELFKKQKPRVKVVEKIKYVKEKEKLIDTSIGKISIDTLKNNKQLIKNAFNKLIKEEYEKTNILNRKVIYKINEGIEEHAREVSGLESNLMNIQLYEDPYYFYSDNNKENIKSIKKETPKLRKKYEKLLKQYKEELNLPEIIVKDKNQLDVVKELEKERDKLIGEYKNGME